MNRRNGDIRRYKDDDAIKLLLAFSLSVCRLFCRHGRGHDSLWTSAFDKKKLQYAISLKVTFDVNESACVIQVSLLDITPAIVILLPATASVEVPSHACRKRQAAQI